MSAGLAACKVFLLFFATGEAILHGYGTGGNGDNVLPVVDEPSFGCRWFGGGMGSALECTCLDDTIQVLDVQEDSLPAYDLNAIRIRKCPGVTFGKNAIKSMRNLREIELSDISELNLEERCFHWDGYMSADVNTPSLKVIVRNTTIKQIASYSFMGKINRIEFDKVKIENIAPFAFSSISQSQNIAFYNSHVVNMQPQAFKKFSTENLNIHNSNFEYLPSRSFSDLIVSDSFMISNSNMTTIHPGAFIIDNPERFEVTNSNFTSLDGEAFKVMTRGDVVFRTCILNSTYGSPFVGISLNLRNALVRKLIILDNVTFKEITSRTFKINTTGFDLKINNIFTQDPCDCRRIDQLGTEYPLESIYCFQDTPTSYQEYKSSSCSILASNATLIIALCTALILVILIGTGLWCYFKKVYKCDKYGEDKDDKAAKLSMIVPDGRTYRETELHVIVERTDLLTTDL